METHTLTSYISEAFGSCDRSDLDGHHRTVRELFLAGAMMVAVGPPHEEPQPTNEDFNAYDRLREFCLAGCPIHWHPEACGIPEVGMRLAFLMMHPDGVRITALEVIRIEGACPQVSWAIPHMYVRIKGYADLDVDEFFSMYRDPDTYSQMWESD